MLSTRGRRPASVVVEPVARGLLRLGLTPNVVTVIGAVITCAIAVLLIPQGHLFTEASGRTPLRGLVDRPERRIVGLGGVGLQGRGVPYAIDVALWALAAGSVYTVIQRLLTASRNPEALEHIAPPPGTRDADPQGAASR